MWLPLSKSEDLAKSSRVVALARGAATWGLAVALLALTACQSRDGYFGLVRKPTSKRLVFENRAEPRSLDPHLQMTVREYFIEDCLYSALARLHPYTLEPTADIATHYERNAEATRFTFYLRGHPAPGGIKLPNTDTMQEQFRAGKIPEDLSRGHKAPPDHLPARWSDGKPVTAHDFVYSWQRLFDPKTASPYAQSFAFVANSAEILAGKMPPSDLGVKALDPWTLEVSLARPTEFFLMVTDAPQFFVLPRQSIEAAEARGAPASWTAPGKMVTAGPFALAEWRPFEKLTVRKNSTYWEAGLTGLDEIEFLPIADNLLNVNLYRTGEADTLDVPPSYLPLIRNMRDYTPSPILEVYFLVTNTLQPPLDNVLVRYALNMATDKKQIVKLMNGRQRPARTYGYPLEGYQPPASVPVSLEGRVYDVSSYDPAAARDLLRMAGYPGGLKKNGERLQIEFMYSMLFPVGEDLAGLLSRQWRENLGIDITLTKVDPAQYPNLISFGDLKGIALYAWVAFPEPSLFFEFLFSSEQAGGTFWKPPGFIKAVAEARATVDTAERSRRASVVDRLLMEGMPVIPLIHNSWDVMLKPYVKGLPLNLIQELRFKYAWVETN